MTARDWLRDTTVTAVIHAISWVERWQTGIVFNPLDPKHVADPYPLYAELRRRGRVHQSRLTRGPVLSHYEDVAAALHDDRLSTNPSHSRGWPRQRKRLAAIGRTDDEIERRSILASDPPDHTRLRKLVSKAFTPRAISELEARMGALVDELLAPVRGTTFDLCEVLAWPFPVIVIAELLGVPRKDRARFKAWSDEVVLSIGVVKREGARRSLRAGRELGEYFTEIARERREEPRDDLLSGLLAAEEEGDRLTLQEVLTMCSFLLVAGNETTAKMIGNGMAALFRDPEQLDALRTDPDLDATAPDELLRFDGPVQMTTRNALEDLELAGHRVEKGRQVILCLGSANRDPARFAQPDRLDLARVDNPHVALGHGRHFCLGASLARLETRVALRGLLDRFPGLEQAGDVVWGDNAVLRGVAHLPVRVG